MSAPTTEACRSCGAAIIWAISAQAKSMPVDAQPSPSGSMVLEYRVPGRNPLARVIPAELRGARTDLHTSHFATCPQAANWRKRRAS